MKSCTSTSPKLVVQEVRSLHLCDDEAKGCIVGRTPANTSDSGPDEFGKVVLGIGSSIIIQGSDEKNRATGGLGVVELECNHFIVIQLKSKLPRIGFQVGRRKCVKPNGFGWLVTDEGPSVGRCARGYKEVCALFKLVHAHNGLSRINNDLCSNDVRHDDTNDSGVIRCWANGERMS